MTRQIRLWGKAALGALGMLLVAGVAEPAGPFQFVPLTPCRIVDTRNPPGPTGGPALAANTQRSFPIVAIQEIKEMIPMPRKRAGGRH